jgi:hypothetical protein
MDLLFLSTQITQQPTQLRDVMSLEIAKDPAETTTGARLDVMPWLSRMTLDVIGLAGELSGLVSRSAIEWTPLTVVRFQLQLWCTRRERETE